MQRSDGIYGFMPLRRLPSLATIVALVLSLMWTDAADARHERGASFAAAAGFAAMDFDDIITFDPARLPDVADSTYPGGSLGDLFRRGDLIGGFAAGFLGSGALGLLFGHGAVGELSGVASALGLLCQLALIAMLVRLIWVWWHDDKVDARAGLSPRQLADAYGRPRHEGLPDLDRAPRLDMGVDENADDGLGHPK